MTAETVSKTIQLILAPVVMVTACAILAGGLLTRYAAINDRLRAITRERLDLLRAGANGAQRDPLMSERLEELDAQVPGLLHRHQQARDALLSNYGASLIFIADMFVIALAATTGTAWLPTLVLIVFLAGIAVLFVGLMLILLEVRTSHEAVHYEVRRVTGLGVQSPGTIAD
jgi:hypothetical protein